METMRPFIALSGEPDEKLEYSFSQLLDGHCLHGSALGAEPTVLEREKRPVTVFFLITHGDPWQIGRMIERSNALGALRVAALYDLGKLGDADTALHVIEDDMRKAGLKFPHAVQAEEVSAIFGALGDAELLVKPGVRHRIESSRYYRQQFLQIVRGLHIRRVRITPTSPAPLLRR